MFLHSAFLFAKSPFSSRFPIVVAAALLFSLSIWQMEPIPPPLPFSVHSSSSRNWVIGLFFAQQIREESGWRIREEKKRQIAPRATYCCNRITTTIQFSLLPEPIWSNRNKKKESCIFLPALFCIRDQQGMWANCFSREQITWMDPLMKLLSLLLTAAVSENMTERCLMVLLGL